MNPPKTDTSNVKGSRLCSDCQRNAKTWRFTTIVPLKFNEVGNIIEFRCGLCQDSLMAKLKKRNRIIENRRRVIERQLSNHVFSVTGLRFTITRYDPGTFKGNDQFIGLPCGVRVAYRRCMLTGITYLTYRILKEDK